MGPCADGASARGDSADDEGNLHRSWCGGIPARLERIGVTDVYVDGDNTWRVIPGDVQASTHRQKSAHCLRTSPKRPVAR